MLVELRRLQTVGMRVAILRRLLATAALSRVLAVGMTFSCAWLRQTLLMAVPSAFLLPSQSLGLYLASEFFILLVYFHLTLLQKLFLL